MEREAGRALDSEVPKDAAQRLSNQVARAYRGTFGAQSGLQTVVRLVTERMLRAGTSPADVSRVLTRYVESQSARLVAESQAAAAAGFDVRILIELTAQCVVDAALEAAPTPRGTHSRRFVGSQRTSPGPLP